MRDEDVARFYIQMGQICRMHKAQSLRRYDRLSVSLFASTLVFVDMTYHYFGIC